MAKPKSSNELKYFQRNLYRVFLTNGETYIIDWNDGVLPLTNPNTYAPKRETEYDEYSLIGVQTFLKYTHDFHKVGGYTFYKINKHLFLKPRNIDKIHEIGLEFVQKQDGIVMDTTHCVSEKEMIDMQKI